MPPKKEPIKMLSPASRPVRKAAVKPPAKSASTSKAKTNKSKPVEDVREDLDDAATNEVGTVRKPGRPKGSLDRGGSQIREMIVTALTDLGGPKYFVHVARTRPDAFLMLIGKLLPTQVTGPNNSPLVPPSISFVCNE